MSLTSISATAERIILLIVVAFLLTGTGCGTIKTRSATDQLLISDAVDRSISQIDFTPLAQSTVFLDTKYIRQVPGAGFVNADYIIAALREKMMFSGCVLQERRDEAEYVVEVRVGALGTDGHEITYGIPASQALNATANLVANSPVVPSIPEISLAKRDERRAEVKLGVFAYHRESKEPVWQPGAVQGTSMAKATWFFGAGPFEQGNIYESVQLAGQPINQRVPDLESGAIAMLSAPKQWIEHAQGTEPANEAAQPQQHTAEPPEQLVQRLGLRQGTVATAIPTPNLETAAADSEALGDHVSKVTTELPQAVQVSYEESAAE